LSTAVSIDVMEPKTLLSDGQRQLIQLKKLPHSSVSLFDEGRLSTNWIVQYINKQSQ